MKYRCPYCGEPGFSFFAKIDFVPRLIELPEYVQGARCMNCRQRAVYHSRFGGRLGHFLIDWALKIALLVCCIAALLSSSTAGKFAVFFGGLVGYVVVVVIFKGLFCYLDKPARADYVSDPTFRITVDGSERLWLHVRVGEIYLFRFPARKKKEDGPYIIGMVTKVTKEDARSLVTVRVVKEYLMDAPLADESVTLTTQKNFAAEGTVEKTYRLAPQEP